MYRYDNLPPPPIVQQSHLPSSPPKKKKKLDFACLKKDTCNSLFEVEHFLCDFNSFIKYMKLYNLLRRK